jgi:hypothetical protein
MPDSPLENHVIPAKAGIQMIKNISTEVGQHHGFVRFAAYFSLLDTGLRRYDGLMDNSKYEPPRGIVAQQAHFSPAIESFLVGTDQQVHAKILYPTNGTIIAMDPDIPVKHQRVQLSAKGSEQIAWAMDGNDIGSGTDIGWKPTGGRHRLVLSDTQGNELDAVSFEVRGTWAP